MELQFTSELSKNDVTEKVKEYLKKLGIAYRSMDSERPWGAFFVIDENDTDRFIEQYFPSYDRNAIGQFGTKLSPKILLVAPEQKLSWQYHNRRAELWRGVSGPAGFIRSKDDSQGKTEHLNDGDTVQFGPQERHRLVGLENWGVVAEIWQHTNPSEPSDENDIVRLNDDYGRGNK